MERDHPYTRAWENAGIRCTTSKLPNDLLILDLSKNALCDLEITQIVIAQNFNYNLRNSKAVRVLPAGTASELLEKQWFRIH